MLPPAPTTLHQCHLLRAAFSATATHTQCSPLAPLPMRSPLHLWELENLRRDLHLPNIPLILISAVGNYPEEICTECLVPSVF
jgi:hypothetical protein